MKLNRRELTLLSLYLFMVMAIGIYFFFGQIISPRYKLLDEQISSKEESLLKVSKILNSKAIVDREYNAFQQKFSPKEIKQTVSTEILQDIEGKASDAGLYVINLKPLTVKQEGLYGEFDFKLETEGDLKKLGKFLYDLDDSEYIFGIKYTQINAQNRGGPLKVQLFLSAAIAKK